MTKLENKIDFLIAGLEQIIARPPIPPIPSIPAIPPIPPIPPIAPIPPIPALVHTGDHDLLIKLETKVDALIASVNKLTGRDELYVLKDDFNFWRNLLVSGILLSIFIGIIMNLIVK